jgi:hypothetical protein
MAAETLITSLVKDRALTLEQAVAMRPGPDRPYAAAREANRWATVELRTVLAGVAGQVRALR